MINLLEEDPVNIAGVAVRTRLENQQRVAAELGQWPGVEVHLLGEQGQLVVTVEEAPGEKCLVDTITRINHLPGVIAASLIFSHSDDALTPPQEKTR